MNKNFCVSITGGRAFMAVFVMLIFFTGAAQPFTQSLKPAGDNMVSLQSLLEEMISARADVSFPVPYYSAGQLTSYDRRSKKPGTSGWHANDDFSGFIRLDTIDGRIEKVLFDEQGPGVITRIITTGNADSANLRIYFDDEPHAAILIPAYDISLFPLAVPPGLLYKHEHYSTTRGCSFYYPLPYSRRCRITVDNPKRDYVYHVNFRRYSPGTNVKSFQLAEGRRLGSTTARVAGQLLHPSTDSSGNSSITKTLKTGEVARLTMPAGEKAIRMLHFRIAGFNAGNYALLLRGLIVKATFDGAETVSAPLSDFSGAGMGAPRVDSWYLSADGNGGITIRFVMPYRQSASVSLTNLTDVPATAVITAKTSAWEWTDGTLYFHCTWRQENGLETNKGLDFHNAFITGRGIFKGDVLSLYNYSPRWYGEGDEHIWVDRDTFPSHFGCGTEDYYNTTYAPIHVYFNPFGGAPREDDEASRGYNTFVRTRNLDVIPFKEQLRFEFELISWDGGKVDYASTVYWYGNADSRARQPSPDSAALYHLPEPIFTGQKNTSDKN